MTDRRLDDVTVVVPTVGRQSLSRLLRALSQQAVPVGRLILVDDRRRRDGPLRVPERLRRRTRVVRSDGRGPAAARNMGWRASTSPWIVFLDDDVVPTTDWSRRLVHDLSALSADADIAASQARIAVPIPTGRRPTDRERNVARLEQAPWITADLLVRRQALVDVDGFDERFPGAYREDSDLALRLQGRGWRLVRGERHSNHPVEPAPWWWSVAAQRGNRDDALMLALHGRSWRPAPGRRRRHVMITAAGIAAIVLASSGRRWLALVPAGGWALGTAEFAGARIAPGPRSAGEIASMLLTSALIPPAASFYWIAGRLSFPRGRTAPWGDQG